MSTPPSRRDPATRIAAAEPALRARLSRPSLLESVLQQTYDRIDPHELAGDIVALLAACLPMGAWAVAVTDLTGQVSIMAERGVIPEMAPALPVVAALVERECQLVTSAALREDARLSASFSGTVVALPLECRGRCFGAVIGLDATPSGRGPRLQPTTVKGLRRLLAPLASALDKTLLLKRVEGLSVTDDLTRLYNSRYLNQVLRRETKRAVRNGRPLSLLFIDLDGFKLINDTYGHLCGSQALVEAGAVIRGSGRETDIAARFGGDEFALILPDTGGAGAIAVAERVCDRLANHAFLAERGLHIRLTASIGIATLPDSATSPEELVQAADSAMYHVKDRGKNGLQTAPASTDR